MHAIGKGILILETQQSSDTTYRVYDFDRRDDAGNLRELHIEKSIDVLTIGPVANSTPAHLKAGNLDSTLLVANPFFTVYKWNIQQEIKMKQTVPYLLVSVIEGEGAIQVGETSYPLQKGKPLYLTSQCDRLDIYRPNGHHRQSRELSIQKLEPLNSSFFALFKPRLIYLFRFFYLTWTCSIAFRVPIFPYKVKNKLLQYREQLEGGRICLRGDLQYS